RPERAARDGRARAPERTRPPVGRRRGWDTRLLRQRVVVFVTVTFLVALGIAAAQGQSPL
ncbi:serine/threonine protein kinase, partial [Streptomyces sp. ventii]|nr:serine/threonine protein kinase [Streptomyces spiramenti]